MPDHDEPKISPSVMKAAEYKTVVEIDMACPSIRKLAAGIVATYGFAGPPNTDELIERIDAATHLSAKEAALRLAQECIIDILEDIAYDAFPEYPKPGCRKDRILTKAYKFLHSPITKEALKP